MLRLTVTLNAHVQPPAPEKARTRFSAFLVHSDYCAIFVKMANQATLIVLAMALAGCYSGAAADVVSFDTTAFTALLLGGKPSWRDEILQPLQNANGHGLIYLLVDWGGTDTAPYTEPGQTACAVGMGVVAEESSANIGLLLGDNFYTTGLHGDAHSTRFDETFENVYTAPSLQSLPFYV